jgi:predicted negative regulator of RcsB-dependent stress response
MRAEERHKLKTNELAESLSELPEYFRKHGNKILTGGIVVLVVVLGFFWWRNAQANTRMENIATLNDLLAQKNQMQALTAQKAQLEKNANDSSLPYDATTLAGALQTVAEKASGSSTAMIAMQEQAEALRSQLLYSSLPITDEQRKNLCTQAEGIYEQMKREFPNSHVAYGSANLGLGLLAEEQGNWDKAREIYNQMVADGQSRLAGTMFPVQAQIRLKKIDEISKPIEFPLPAIAPAASSEPAAAPGEPAAVPSEPAAEPAPAQTATEASVPTESEK